MSEDTLLCADCGTPEPTPHALHWIDNPIERHADIRVCDACFVWRWPCPIRFVFYAGVPTAVRDHLESVKILRRLQSWFRESETMLVHIFHRREAETLDWQYKWDRHRGGPIEPYSYRGFCTGLKIVILWDETETLESIEWITYHELGHHACNSQVRMFDDAMSVENRNEGRDRYEWKDDAGHEADSEERLVNRIATAHMGGKEYARPWWRPRVKALLAGEKELPDPHNAPPPPPIQEPVRKRSKARR